MVPVRFGRDPGRAWEIIQQVADEVVGEYVKFARQAWKKVVGKYRIEDALVEPTISMVFDENWMTFTLRYVVDYKARRMTKDRLFSRIWEAVEQTGGKVMVASSSMDINLMDAPGLDVRFSPTDSGMNG